MKSLVFAAIVLATARLSAGSCPAETGWEEYNEYCYYVSPRDQKFYTWDVALSNCQKKSDLNFQVTLASIHDDAENAYITNRLKTPPRSNDLQVWIGVQKRTNAQPFAWTDGSTYEYSKWFGSSTDSQYESSAVFYPDGYWRYEGVISNYGFVCKTPKGPDTYSCSDRSRNPCTKENADAGKFYFPNDDPHKFVQCSEWGQCWVMPCAPGTTWNQQLTTCT